MKKVLGIMLVLLMASATQAITITMTDLGDPDLTGIGGAVYTGLQRFKFTVAKEAGDAAQPNAVSVTVSSPNGDVHQVFAYTNVFGTITYTDSPMIGDVNALVQPQMDTFFMSSLFTLVASAADDDINLDGGGNLIEDVGGTAQSHPTGPAETLLQTAFMTSGYGNVHSFAGAVPSGSEQDSYDVFHIVVPDTATDVSVTIGASGVGVTEVSETWVLIPEPATMGLMVLGGLAMLRRRR